ncbi:TonB-dependent receptor [Chitinophaga horti]|uniref:TonB-dependent receptor n=1 Tax=Chitinophaga horti TaxID=2920382 RepID=A0ABY6J724_9BACT|nr:TonB-dependent receptor [Chitinophaga horti]UYQ95397.1 TonB-dependent receptor [Chitinophaga horti]
MIQIVRLSILMIFLPVAMLAQNRNENGAIRGQVTTSDGQPAMNVTVLLLQTGKGAYTNEKGEYLIRGVKPGSYQLKVTSVEVGGQQQAVSVTGGQTTTVNLILTASAAQLQEVTVTGRNHDKVNAIVAKIPLTNLENPQVYNSVPAELMKQQGVTNYDDALRNVPGITRTWESTGRAGDGATYFALRGFDAQAFLTNGLPGLVSGNLDPANVEEIQVLKGPSGTLFGGSFFSYGGIINTITKKAYFGYGGEIGYNAGSFGLNRVTADVNTMLSKKEKIALRVNAAYHSENSWQDAGFKKSLFFAPSLNYEVNDKLSFQVLTEILQEERR